jgi:hypothetical protein
VSATREQIREGLIDRVANIDYWGARSYPSAKRTATKIVDTVIMPALDAASAGIADATARIRTDGLREAFKGVTE